MTLDIPNYRILEKIGVGAQTRLYRARCMRTGKDYTVKVVKLVRPEDATFLDLLRNEHSIGSLMDHPVLRKVYDLRFVRHRLRVRGAMLFMEYVDGITLSDKAFRAPLTEVLRIFIRVADALRAMHQAGWVHADLKPSNILVTAGGDVKLIDFGQSSKIHEAKPRIQGTIDYIAPEQVQRGVLDPRTDVFCLGAALHRVLIGRAIPTAMNQTVTMNSQGLVGKRLEEVRKPTMEELPGPVVQLIQDCCHSDPDDRVPDMPTVAERLEMARTVLVNRATAPLSDLDHDDHDDLDFDDDFLFVGGDDDEARPVDEAPDPAGRTFDADHLPEP